MLTFTGVLRRKAGGYSGLIEQGRGNGVMDAQSLHFALYLAIAAGIYLLVTVGLDLVRRLARHADDAQIVQAPAVDGELHVPRND